MTTTINRPEAQARREDLRDQRRQRRLRNPRQEGDFIVLTPGGRFSKDIEGLRPLAQELVKGGYRVLLWDRPNCGKSDVQFYGQSESHMRAETLHKLITGLDIGPCIIAGGSGGARDSMLTTMLYPEMVRKLVVWNIVGGMYGSFVLGSHYVVPSLLAFRGNGMEAVVNIREWKERIAENPANKQRFLDFDADEFLKVMLRWLNAYVPKAGQTIPGVDDDLFDNIKVPTLIIRGGENDYDHPKRTSLEVNCLIKGSQLIEPPWPEDAWERSGEEMAQGKVKRFNMFDTWVQAAPAILKFLDKSDERLREEETALMQQRGSNVHFAVQRRLERRVDSAFRNALEVGPAQGHVDDVQTVVSRRAGDFAGEPETRKHAVGVLVGAPADKGHHTRGGRRAERLGAQRDRVPLQLIGIAARHQHLHFSTPGRHCGDVVVEHLDVRRVGESAEGRHAVG